MKWEEMTTVKKIISVVGWICGILYLVLHFFVLCEFLPISRAVLFPLFSVFWVCQGIIQKEKKHARWYYIIAAGYVLLALLIILF